MSAAGAFTRKYTSSSSVVYLNYLQKTSQGFSEGDFARFVPGVRLILFLIEVEAEQHLRARSLAKYHKRYAPEIAVKTSMRAEMLAENGILRIPLYMISTLKRCADGRSKGK